MAAADTANAPDAASESQQAQQQAPKAKRAAVACTRCRRYRTKCIAAPPYRDPCENCAKNNAANECYYPARGEVDTDRYHRRKRAKEDHEGTSNGASVNRAGSANSGTSAAPSHPIPSTSTNNATAQALPNGSGSPVRQAPPLALPPPAASLGLTTTPDLPPTSDIVEAIESFSNCYFQISFLPQSFLLENIKERPQCISRFLLLSILAVAAQWTPSLVKRFGGPDAAGAALYDQAKSMIATEMLKPTLQACQSFFLLSIYQWGRGNSEESSMLVGVSVRMVGLLALHREGSYALSASASPEEITMSEVARRTFWAIITHEHLASGLNRLASIRLDEIDTLLPGDESDFSFGMHTEQRASLQGTIPHRANPSNATNCPRSLFASMVQSHALWANIAQWACHNTRDQPWLPQSEFNRLNLELVGWYDGLPPRQRWSKQNLRGMLAERKDIPFLSHIACYKLAGIVLRRKYLASMAASVEPDGTLDESILAPPGFWRDMAKDMVLQSFDLIVTIDDFFSLRPSKLGFAPILIFALYIAGNISVYLARWPTLCPEEAPNAARYLERALNTLSQLSASWPMAEAWHDSLRNSARTIGKYNDFGELKATAAAEKSADESVGIFRHTKTSNPVPVTSPSFSGGAYGPQSGPSLAASTPPDAALATSPQRHAPPELSISNVLGYPPQRVQSGHPQQGIQGQTDAMPPNAYGQPAFPPQPPQGLHPGAQSSMSNGQSSAHAYGSSFEASYVGVPIQTMGTVSYGSSSGAPMAHDAHINSNPSNGFIASDLPPLFPLTNDGLPYDAFEDDLVAFFRGEVPSYLDSFGFGN